MIVALIATLVTERAPIDLVEGTAFLFYILLVFFFPLYMIGSLSKEDRRFATWMQIPLPGWALISAKLASGVIYTTVLSWMTWIMTRLLVPRGIERFEQSELVSLILTVWGAGKLLDRKAGV